MTEPAPLQFPKLHSTDFNENMKSTAEYASSTIVPSSADFLNAMQQITLGIVALSQQASQTPSESDMSIDSSTNEFDPTVLNDALTDLERINRSPPQTRYTKAHDELFANSEPICSPIQKRLTNGRAESPSKRRKAVMGVIEISPEEDQEQQTLPESLQKLNIKMSSWQNLESVQAKRQTSRRERQAQQTRSMYSPSKSIIARSSPSHPQKTSTVKPVTDLVPRARTPRLQNPIPSLRSPIQKPNSTATSTRLEVNRSTQNDSKPRSNIQTRTADTLRQPNTGHGDPRKIGSATHAPRQPRALPQSIPRSRSSHGNSIQAPKPQPIPTANRRPLSYAPLSTHSKPQPRPHTSNEVPHSEPQVSLQRAASSGKSSVSEPANRNSRPISAHRSNLRPSSQDVSRDTSRTEPRMVPRYAPRPESRPPPITKVQNAPATLRPQSRLGSSNPVSLSPNSSFSESNGNTSIINNQRVSSSRPLAVPATRRIVRPPPKSVSQRSISDQHRATTDMYANLPSYARPTQSALRKSKSYQPSEDLSSVLKSH